MEYFHLSSSVLRHNPAGGYAITMETNYRHAWKHRTQANHSRLRFLEERNHSVIASVTRCEGRHCRPELGVAPGDRA